MLLLIELHASGVLNEAEQRGITGLSSVIHANTCKIYLSSFTIVSSNSDIVILINVMWQQLPYI